MERKDWPAEIDGHSLSTVRDFLRLMDERGILHAAKTFFGDDRWAVSATIQAIIAHGFLAIYHRGQKHVITDAGYALCDSRTLERHPHPANDQAIAGILDRVAEIAADDSHLFEVAHIALIEAPAGSADTLEILIVDRPKALHNAGLAAYPLCETLREKMVDQGMEAGASSYSARLFWPSERIRRAVKARKRSISIADRLELHDGTMRDFRLIYSAPGAKPFVKQEAAATGQESKAA